MVKAVKRKPFREARSLSPPSVCCYLFGTPWVLLYAASTNCKSSCSGPLLRLVQKLNEFSDVFMDSVNRDVSMRLMVRHLSLVSLTRLMVWVGQCSKEVCRQTIHPHNASVDGQCRFGAGRQDHQVCIRYPAARCQMLMST